MKNKMDDKKWDKCSWKEPYSDDMSTRHDLQINKRTTEKALDIQIWELENAIRKVQNNEVTSDDKLPLDLMKHIMPSNKKNF